MRYNDETGELPRLPSAFTLLSLPSSSLLLASVGGGGGGAGERGLQRNAVQGHVDWLLRQCRVRRQR